MRAVMVPKRPGLVAEVAAGHLGRTARGVEVTQGRQGQGPPSGAVGQRLLHDAEVAPLPDPAHQRGGHVVESRLVQPDHEIDVGPRLVLEPREHDQVAPVATVDRRGVVVVPQDGHRPGAGLDAAHRGQQQRGQLGVAQRIGADGETVFVVEQAEGGLFAGAQEMGLVGHAAHSRHHVGPALPHPGDDVDQAGPPGQEHLGPLDLDVTRRRDLAQPQPRLDERAQCPVALGRHSWTGLSSGARSNHKKPYGGRVMV